MRCSRTRAHAEPSRCSPRVQLLTLQCCRIFDLYTDYVLKNPFYEMEMPIRCELFDQHLYYTISGLHRRWGHAA